MDTLVDEILQRIIHKPVARHPCQGIESRASNADSEVGSLSAAIGAGMPGMGCALIQNLQGLGVEPLAQSPSQVIRTDVHGVASSFM
jgi:hypothetical protein